MSIDLLSEEEVASLEAEMKARFEELEKLEGQFDVEVDIPELTEVIKDEAPVTTSLPEGERDRE